MASMRSALAITLLLGCGESGGTTTTPERPSAPPEEPTAQTEERTPARPAGETPDALPQGLLIAYSQFPVADGRVVPQPGPARLEILTRAGGEWRVQAIEDQASNVFHKAMLYTPPHGERGILTLGGTAAAVKLWRRNGDQWVAQTLWEQDFGGRFSRMRDAELANLDGRDGDEIVVATHDRGIVAVLTQGDDAAFRVTRLDERPNTFVHEIELGDLNGDGRREIYATPSDPNTLEGGAQPGRVMRYELPASGDPAPGVVVADLGDRHAKEIYVGDVDGDGRDELYVAVEGLMRGEEGAREIVEPVEIRRYDHDTPANAGVVIARIQDSQTRFLTVGDLDGDGRREMIAAAFSSGVWLLRPGRNARAEWSSERVDQESSGFEHAALVADLDENGTSELYVAADEQGEVRRYVWVNGRPRREVIHRRDVPRSRMTWNLMTVPAAMLGAQN
jgi:hypothetical protein